VQYKLLAVAVVGGMIALCPFAKADEWDKRTVVTFKQPIEIPGMVLPAGTYVMKLFDSPADRDVVQIFNKTETRIFKTVFAVPTYRAEPTGKTVITFEERTAGSPQAIKDWYYPGDLRGEEFIYHKPHLMLAAQTTTPAPPMQASSKPAPAQAATPAPAPASAAPSQPVQMAENTPAPAPAPAPAQSSQPSQATPPTTLPKTASDAPLAGLLGMISLAAGLVLRKRNAASE